MRHSTFFPNCFRFFLCFLLSLALLTSLTAPAIAAEPQKPSRLVAIAAGEELSLALNDLGQLYSWGYNWNGQLGDGMDGWGTAKPKPGIVLSNIKAISSGAVHSLALDNAGKLYVFGNSWDGQLGIGSAGIGSGQTKPVAVMTDVYTMAAGAAHSLVVTSDSALYAFGRNRSGQLGNGDLVSQTRPVQTISSGVYRVTAGDQHSMAVMLNGSLMVWGNNASAQLGTGDLKQALKPIKILDDVYNAYAGRENSFAIKSDGSLWGWGKGVASLLNAKAGPEALQKTPLKIMDQVKEVALGADHLLILTTDGKLYAAGQNWLDQLGLPRVTASNTPQLVLENVETIAAGGWHSLALDRDGALWAWGDNTYGQLGSQMFENLKIPTKITVINLPPSVLYNDGDPTWSGIRPKLAVDRVVLPLQATLSVLKIPYKLHQNKLLEFDYKDQHYLHLIGSNIFYLDGKKVRFPMISQRYQGEIVFLAYNTVELFGFSVRWDPTAQLLFLEHDPS